MCRAHVTFARSAGRRVLKLCLNRYISLNPGYGSCPIACPQNGYKIPFLVKISHIGIVFPVIPPASERLEQPLEYFAMSCPRSPATKKKKKKTSNSLPAAYLEGHFSCNLFMNCTAHPMKKWFLYVLDLHFFGKSKKKAQLPFLRMLQMKGTCKSNPRLRTIVCKPSNYHITRSLFRSSL